jgi:hypothetical protein
LRHYPHSQWISLRLAELAASADPTLNAQALKIIETLHIAATSPEVIATLPPEVQTLMTQVAETAFAAANPSSPTISPLAPTLDAAHLPQLVEALVNPALKEQLQSNPKTAELVTALDALRTQDGTLPPDTLSQPFRATASQIASPADLISSFSSRSTPEIISAQKAVEQHLGILTKSAEPVLFTSFPDPHNLTATKIQDTLCGNTRGLSPNEKNSLNIIAQHVKDHPDVLDRLTPHEKQLVAVAVTKNAIDQITENKVLPLPLQKEIKAALQSQNIDRIAQVIGKALTTFPPNRLPPELSILSIVAPYLMPRSNTDQPKEHLPTGNPLKQQHTTTPEIPHQERHEDKRHINPPSRPNDPITSQLPHNDNIQTPKLKPEQKPSVCAVTGAEICLCDKFNEVAKNMKQGEKLELGNGIAARVIEIKVNDKGEEEKSFAIHDGDREIVTGSSATIQNFFKDNDKKIEEDLQKRFGEPTRNDNPSSLPVMPPQAQPIIAIFENVNKPEENKDHSTPDQHDGDIDMDIDFGEDIHPLKTSSSTFSPR